MATPTSAVEGAPCGAVGKRKPGWSGYLLRLHPPKGGKVAVQVTTWDQPPKALADGSWYGRQLGKGEGYIYPHSDPAGFDVDHLPDELKGTKYYEPSGSGEEES
jgi:hypothetical protein